MAWLVDKRPIPGRREGSIGTIIYFRASCLSFFYLKKRETGVKRNGKKILEHKFGRDAGSRSSFWSWYEEMES